MPITELSQLDLDKKYSYTDYLSWRLQERIELIRGRVVKMSPAPSRRHQKMATSLSALVWLHFRKMNCQVFEAPFDVRLPVPRGEKDRTVVQPDLCVVCDLDKLDDRGCDGAPDLVVEILSPGNTTREMKDKYEVYEEAGVREYWLVDPEHEAVTVYLRNEQGIFIGLQPVTAGSELQSSIFPELKIDLQELFEE